MKRLIRASISPSAPDWLRKVLSTKHGSFKRGLIDKYNISLDTAEFSDHDNGNSIPIYLLDTDYSKVVYCPGVNDDDSDSINGRYRKLGSIAKSKLPEMAIDVVFVDLSDSNNTFEKKDRYRDPRYSYRNYPKGQYAGQYMTQNYVQDEDGGHYEDAGWSMAGRTPSNERRARDKSGYKVPSPEEKITEYYTRFPDRVTTKVDKLYDRLQEVKAELMDVDFNSPIDYHEDQIARAYRYFGDALHSYRQLLDSLDENRQFKYGTRYLDEYVIQEFSRTVSSIKSDLTEVEKMIGVI